VKINSRLAFIFVKREAGTSFHRVASSLIGQSRWKAIQSLFLLHNTPDSDEEGYDDDKTGHRHHHFHLIGENFVERLERVGWDDVSVKG